MGVSISCEIGTTSSTATLASLGIPAPLTTFTKGIKTIMSDGTIVYRGWQSTRWHWGFLGQAHIETLRAYSGTVYIITPNITRTNYILYTGIISFPEDESGTGFDIDFTHLVEVVA